MGKFIHSTTQHDELITDHLIIDTPETPTFSVYKWVEYLIADNVVLY